MRETRGRWAVTAATVLALVVSLAGVRDAAAVAAATASGIRITDPRGGPVAQATVTLTFNGETKTARTDDDGVVAIVFGNSANARRGAVVLPKDGSGTISYPGGPEGGEAFTVRGGVLAMAPASVGVLRGGPGAGQPVHDVDNKPAVQPPPPPEPETILDEIDTPAQVQADKDLKTLGQDKTRAKAIESLRKANAELDQLDEDGKSGALTSDSPEVARLREAVRYYARAHGLSADIDDLIDTYGNLQGAARSDVQLPRAETTEEIVKRNKELRADLTKQFGAGFGDLFDALYTLRAWKAAAAQQAPTPPRTITSAQEDSGGGGLGKKAYVAAAVVALGAGAVALGGGSSSAAAPGAPPPDFAARYNNKTFNAMLRISGCVQHEGQLVIETTYNPTTNVLVIVKGGLPFTSEQFDPATGRFRARHRGRVNFPGLGFVDLDWPVDGVHGGNTIAGSGPAMLTSNPGACPGGPPQTSFDGTAR